MVKANKYIKECGPYKVNSISQDGQGVRLVIYPAFPEYEDNWPISRVKGEGGGPSIYSALGLAREMEGFLNQPYDSELIKGWHQTLNSLFGIVKRKQKHDRKVAPQ